MSDCRARLLFDARFGRGLHLRLPDDLGFLEEAFAVGGAAHPDAGRKPRGIRLTRADRLSTFRMFLPSRQPASSRHAPA
jgi:hypothetical protein